MKKKKVSIFLCIALLGFIVTAFSFISSCTILEPKKWPAGSNKIILTFDDGPSPEVSNALLDVLLKHKVKATFCLIGENIEKYPTVASRIVSEGHSITAHSYEHRLASLLSQSKLAKENDEWLAIMERQGLPVSKVTHFRPPLGLKTPSVRSEVKRRGFKYAHLTFFVNDATTDVTTYSAIMSKIKKRIKKHQGGAIVLHEMRYKFEGDNTQISKSWLPNAVDDLISWGHENGFTFTTYEPNQSQ